MVRKKEKPENGVKTFEMLCDEWDVELLPRGFKKEKMEHLKNIIDEKDRYDRNKQGDNKEDLTFYRLEKRNPLIFTAGIPGPISIIHILWVLNLKELKMAGFDICIVLYDDILIQNKDFSEQEKKDKLKEFISFLTNFLGEGGTAKGFEYHLLTDIIQIVSFEKNEDYNNYMKNFIGEKGKVEYPTAENKKLNRIQTKVDWPPEKLNKMWIDANIFRPREMTLFEFILFIKEFFLGNMVSKTVLRNRLVDLFIIGQDRERFYHDIIEFLTINSTREEKIIQTPAVLVLPSFEWFSQENDPNVGLDFDSITKMVKKELLKNNEVSNEDRNRMLKVIDKLNILERDWLFESLLQYLEKDDGTNKDEIYKSRLSDLEKELNGVGRVLSGEKFCETFAKYLYNVFEIAKKIVDIPRFRRYRSLDDDENITDIVRTFTDKNISIILAILSDFDEHGDPVSMRLRDIVKDIMFLEKKNDEMKKSLNTTVSNALGELCNKGIVRKNKQKGEYQIENEIFSVDFKRNTYLRMANISRDKIIELKKIKKAPEKFDEQSAE